MPAGGSFPPLQELLKELIAGRSGGSHSADVAGEVAHLLLSSMAPESRSPQRSWSARALA